MYLFSGGLPHGLPVLRVHPGRAHQDLTAGEMLDQIYRIQASTGERVSNVVVMGSGEPFDNYDSLVKFIRLLSDENGLNISQRNITVSTAASCRGSGNLRRRAFL